MKNQWEKLFGASRRALDRKILAECEKQISQADLREIELDIERQERARAKIEEGMAKIDEAVERVIDRAAIARAFGRPLN
jgi:hypothetical protein